jgi:hypothetical protein
MTKLSWIRGAAILLLLTLLSFQTNAQESDDVVSLLTDELDISSSKARGGAGAIFAYAKDNLDDYDFDKIAKGVPDMNDLLDAAPEVNRDTRFGRMSERLNDFDSSMGGKASLADSFDQLDIDPEMISEFLPVVYDYVEEASGERAMELLEELFIDSF